MMSGNGQGQPRGREPVELVLDLFVHTPIGLAVMAWKRVPEMVTGVPDVVGQAVAKGCASLAEAEERISEEVRKARMIGQVAVTFGGRQIRKEVDARLRDARQTAGGAFGSFIPGVAMPDGSNGSGAGSGAGERGVPFVTVAETPTAPASAPESAPSVAAPPRPPAKPTGARKSPAKATAKAAKAPAKATAKAAKAPANETGKPAKAPAKRASTSGTAAPSAGASQPSLASAADLPIREYDGLSASQVVSRLTGLSPDELRAVRSYEDSGRGRRTVLLAIDRLLT